MAFCGDPKKMPTFGALLSAGMSALDATLQGLASDEVKDDEKYQASPQVVAPDSSCKFDPKYKAASIELEDAVSEKLKIFMLAGPAGVGRNLLFNMLTRGWNNYSAKGREEYINLWQISKTSCVMNTMGMLDAGNEAEETYKKLMNNILKAVTTVHIIFVTDMKHERLPSDVALVAYELLEAINMKLKEKPHHNLLINKYPKEYMGTEKEMEKTVATMVLCWKNAVDPWGEGLTSIPFLIGYNEDYRKQTKAQKAVPIIPDFWDWLHHGTTAIKVDPKIKELKKMDKAEKMKLRRDLEKKCKEAAKLRKALEKKCKEIAKDKEEIKKITEKSEKAKAKKKKGLVESILESAAAGAQVIDNIF